MNCITLVGRAGRDPEARYFENGTMVASVTLAVKGRGRDAETEWFNLQIWGKQAQVAADYVRKGGLIGVTGSVKTERWTDRTTGQERSKPVVMVDRLDLLGSRRDSQDPFAGGSSGHGAPPAALANAAVAPAAAPAPHPAHAAAGWQPNPQQGTVAAPGTWNSAPSAHDDDGIPF